MLGSVLTLAGSALLTVAVLGWRGTLPRNPVAGVRTPSSLRSDAAFRAANRVAAPPLVAAGASCVTGGVLCFAVTGTVLAVVAGVTGAGTLTLVVTGGLLGNHAAEATREGPSCDSCGVGGCTAKGFTAARG